MPQQQQQAYYQPSPMPYQMQACQLTPQQQMQIQQLQEAGIIQMAPHPYFGMVPPQLN